MTDPASLQADEWLTYAQVSERLALRTPEAAAARARRGKWPKRIRNTDKAAEVLVPAEVLAEAANRPATRERPAEPPTSPPIPAEALAVLVQPLQDALRHEQSVTTQLRADLERVERERDLAVAKVAGIEQQLAVAQREADLSGNQAHDLSERLDRESQDRRTLQAQADALRDQLAAAQLETATASGTANTERARREAAEAKAQDLQRQVDRLQAPRPRPWWRPW